MADLTTLADVQNYRQQMLDGLKKHGWLSFAWRENSGHERVAEQLIAEGLIEEIRRGNAMRTFKLKESK